MKQAWRQPSKSRESVKAQEEREYRKWKEV